MAETATWRSPAAFWTANSIELFEPAASYGTFIPLALLLTRVVGFTGIEAGWIGAMFSSMIELLPFFTGAIADRIGFRWALALAFAMLSIGHTTLGPYPVKLPVLLPLVLIVVGGSFVTPIITGTVATSSDGTNRARAYSLFYSMMVNIGSFSGKTIAKPVRVDLGLDHGPLPAAYAPAHYPWYVFAAIGLAAFVSLLISHRVTTRLDARKET